jgi:hypothetical protein
MASVSRTGTLAADQRRAASGLALAVVLAAMGFFMVTLDALVVITAPPSIHRSPGGGIGPSRGE